MKLFYFKYRLFNLLNKIGLLKYFNFYTSIKEGKSSFRIPVFHGMGFHLLMDQEKWMNLMFEKFGFSFTNKIFLDVGANLGQTLLKVKSFDNNVRYVGFEPNPNCIYYLIKLIELNEFKNCRIIPSAISDKSSIIELNLPNNIDFDGSASIIADYRSKIYKKIDVVATLANEFHFLLNNDIGFIKIDVEGAELNVLNSLTEIILSNRPYICIEILPVYSEEKKLRLRRQLEIEELINSWNYNIYRINVKDLSFTEINSFGIHSDLDKCNYILSPSKIV